MGTGCAEEVDGRAAELVMLDVEHRDVRWRSRKNCIGR